MGVKPRNGGTETEAVEGNRPAQRGDSYLAFLKLNIIIMIK
jgi:hypothetical protein